MKLPFVIIIPARGGSKGIPEKNIALLGGKPLLFYTIEAARRAGLEGRIVVSTDADDIAEVANRFGAEVIRRPPEISGDTASVESALVHVLDELEKRGEVPETVLTLPPASPFRRPKTIRAFVERFEEIRNEFDAMLSLHEDRAYFWIKKTDGFFSPLFPEASRRRQGRAPLYAENDALYITSTKALRKTGSILGSRVEGFIIGQDEAFDINEPRDLLLAEFLLHCNK